MQPLNEQSIRMELIEAILKTFENQDKLNLVTDSARNYINHIEGLKGKKLKEAIISIVELDKNITKGKVYSKENIDQLLTAALEKLISY